MSLTYRSQSLQDNADSRLSRWYFDIVEGGPGVPPQVRGEDVTAPGRPGRYVGNRVTDFQELLLEGFIRGFGSTVAERSEDWHTNTQTILSVFQLDADPGALEVGPGSNSYLGLSADWEIQARTLDAMEGTIQDRMSFQRWSIRLECVDGLWWVEGS